MPPEVNLKPLPPEEAIAYFRQKGFRLSWHWQDMWHEDHVKAFTVAKAMRMDILKDIRDALDMALAEGTTLEEFRKNLIPILQRKGWWGRRLLGDEAGAVEVQLGSPWRLKTIFNVNIQTAYQVGHYRAMTDPAVLRARPYWRYVAVNDSRTRPEHAAWHNTVLHADDPWWDTHYPPNGWNCRCTVVSHSKRELDRDGLKVSKSPKVKTREWVNPRTGEVIDVPEGIDPGWAYNPGKEYLLWDQMPRQVKVLPGQKTWKDWGRPDIRDVPVELKTPAPEILPSGRTIKEAERIVAGAVGFEGEKFITVRTKDDDLAVIHRQRLRHLVEKRKDARERYANYIIPTLTDPYEIWLTDYEDGLRKQYIGLFEGKENLLVVIRLQRDGSILWNIMQARDKDMNKHRVGWLLWGK